ncbi:unnamed protein product [Leptosia nina]|uniref:Galectin domain-containing protein n=1 Tax=Leptosia nina TaxID=320188 RepID=A0AAV1JRS5_9NEOP
MSNNSLLFSINNEGKVYALSTNGSCWREFMYLGLEFKTLSAVPHFLWAVGGDRQIYLHVHGLEIPIRVKEESYENERWLPLEGFSSRLLPTDRYHFSSQDGTKDRSIDGIRLPSMAWQWEGDWQLELTLDGQPLDHDGWCYAVDFPAQFGPTKQWKSCVRRRKWIRYRKFSAMNSWCAIAPLHKDPTQEPFIDVSIGGNQIPYAAPGTLSVWAITAQGRVMYRSNVSATSPEGLKWINVSIPPNCDIKQISVGPTGLVWALLWSGRAIVRKGVTKDCPTGEAWLEVKSPEETKLTVVSVGYNVVWAVSSDTRVWFRKGVDGNACGSSELAAMGSGWLNINGNMMHISVGINDQVFAIGGSNKSIYWRNGITPKELSGKRWRMVQANMQVSRTSSAASIVSSASNQKHLSLNLLNETVPELKSNINLRNSWEESHSAPIENTLPLKPSKELKQKTSANIENIDLTGKSYETTLKNPRAWSPVRSVGSVVGMEAQPDSDSSVFDIDSGMFFDEEVSQTAWGTCDTAWSFVEAGACSVDSVQPPHWFSDSQNSHNTDITAKWRLQILDELKLRSNYNIDLTKFGIAIEEKGWTRSCEARLVNTNNICEECIVSLYWHSSENTGTLSVFQSDGTIKFIFNLGEVTSVTTSSEPGSPRISLTIPTQSSQVLKIQFISEMEQEEWLNVLVDITTQIHGLSGRPSISSVWAVTNTGDVLNWDPAPAQLTAEKDAGCYTKEIQVFGKDIQKGYTTTLHNNFPPGSILNVTGCLNDDINRFHINLQGPEIQKQRHRIENEVTEIPFHFNMRFDEGVVVCNTKISGLWGSEERYQLPISPGQEFSIKFLCDTVGFTVTVNDKHFCTFKHRLSPENITSAHVLGSLKLFSMEYSSTSVIIGPDEMFWKMIGGYLRKVETCANTVIWGISHDHRAWVYTGGWGGGSLKGLGSNDGIHAMLDTQTYCVYENQRWNPLSGYTSTGLPTDRYMWSDITGKHKRTREHTKLLNRHWHWISEWMIDYSTPGGVDSDGWQYATDFPAPYHGKKIFTDCVRRRRWYRKAQIHTEGPWIRAGSTALLDFSLWSNDKEVSVWAVTLGGDVIYKTGVTAMTPAGTHWEHVNSPQPLVSISICNNIIWVVGRKGELYYREEVTKENPGGSNWKLIEAPKSNISSGYKSGVGAKLVSLTSNSAWILLTNGSLAVRTDISRLQPGGKHWKYLTDCDTTYKHVSCKDQEVWVVRSDGSLHRRLGLTTDNVLGVAWQPILNIPLVYVSVRGAS